MVVPALPLFGKVSTAALPSSTVTPVGTLSLAAGLPCCPMRWDGGLEHVGLLLVPLDHFRLLAAPISGAVVARAALPLGPALLVQLELFLEYVVECRAAGLLELSHLHLHLHLTWVPGDVDRLRAELVDGPGREGVVCEAALLPYDW